MIRTDMPYTQFTVIFHERLEDFVDFDTSECKADIESSERTEVSAIFVNFDLFS